MNREDSAPNLVLADLADLADLCGSAVSSRHSPWDNVPGESHKLPGQSGVFGRTMGQAFAPRILGLAILAALVGAIRMHETWISMVRTCWYHLPGTPVIEYEDLLPALHSLAFLLQTEHDRCCSVFSCHSCDCHCVNVYNAQGPKYGPCV